MALNGLLVVSTFFIPYGKSFLISSIAVDASIDICNTALAMVFHWFRNTKWFFMKLLLFVQAALFMSGGIGIVYHALLHYYGKTGLHEVSFSAYIIGAISIKLYIMRLLQYHDTIATRILRSDVQFDLGMLIVTVISWAVIMIVGIRFDVFAGMLIGVFILLKSLYMLYRIASTSNIEQLLNS
jgi:hypothetical protein